MRSSPASLHAPLAALLGALLFASSACEGSLSGDHDAPGSPGDHNTTVAPGPNGTTSGGSGTTTGGGSTGTTSTTPEPPPCRTPEAVFEREVWPRVASPVCAGCHVEGGIAAQQDATFVLKTIASVETGELTLDAFFAHNLTQFRDVSDDVDGDPRFLAKALGRDHGGGAVVTEGSDEHRALVALHESLVSEGEHEACKDSDPIDPLADITQLSPKRTLRKATMMLASRLPTEAEVARLEGLDEAQARAELDTILRDEVMQGDAFRSWLKHAWNEIFNFRGLWQIDVTFPFQIVSPSDYRARRWGFINSAGAPDCGDSWKGDDAPLWRRFDYPSLQVCQDNTYRRNYLSYRVAWSLLEEPLEMIAWVVMSDRPFTEILTTDVVMMNYYSSIAYYGSAQPSDNVFVEKFGDTLAIETVVHPSGSAIPSVDLPSLHQFRALTSTKRSVLSRDAQDRSEFTYQDGSEDIPRAGLLTSQAFLTRYPTTDTNVNRHRSWAFFLNFLGVDILALADRRGDPVAAEMNSEQPTIDDPNCNVCHKVMDPVAGLFQDFGVDARWQPTRAWPPRDQPNMFGPGSSIVGPEPNVDFDEDAASITPLKWLAQQTIEDPRFAARMVRHAFVQLTGHEPLSLPLDTSKAGWTGRRAAYEAQSIFLKDVASGFAERDFDMKGVIIQIILSPWYRADGVASAEVIGDADRRAGVEGIGDGDQLLTPEYLYQKIAAILERPWQHQSYVMRGNRLNIYDDQAPENDYLLRFNSENDFRYVDPVYRDMYGGIDFFNNTERLTLPSSVMAATSRRIAYELGCGVVAPEFALLPENRALFGDVEALDTVARDEASIRKTITHLMQRMWGVSQPSTVEVDAAVGLFDSVQKQGAEAVSGGSVEPNLLPHCQATSRLEGQRGAFTPVRTDPDYTLRAWAAVVSYLALDPKFLYTW